MKWLRNISIFSKLIYIQMLTAITVVFLISGVYVYVYFEEIKVSKVENLKSLAKILATNSSSALVFGDNATANKILGDLSINEDIETAEIRDVKDNTFAFYSSNKNFTSINYVEANQKFNFKYTDNYLYISFLIYDDTEYIGKLLLKASTADLDNYLYLRIKLSIWVGILAVFIGFILALALQRHISKPIYSLVKLIKEVKENNNFSIRSKLKNKDEIGKLALGINEMLHEIEEKDQHLKENNKNLQIQVKERTARLEENNIKLLHVNEDLVKAKIQAEQSKAVKELFLANMSHEIRTPLNAIIGFQQLLKETNLTESQFEYVSAIDFAGKNLLALINDILDLSKIESGKLLFEDVSFNIHQNIQSVIDLLKQRAIDKNLEIELNQDNKIPSLICGDSTRFSQILINLIGNALKFTEKGKITVSSFLSYENEHEVKCTFEVKDTGIGIDAKNLNKIFERFSQASPDTTRLYGGTGLGLTICKFLVEGFGGTISVQSKLGVGTTFVFDAVFKKELNVTQPNPNVLTTEIVGSTKKIAILLAEDVLINQKLMQKIAENWNYSIDIVENGELALEKVKEKHYDVVLMDIQMPIMNGFVSTIAIRQLEDSTKNSIPIIALTAHASNAEAEKCLNLGMNAYMSKPFDQQQLKQTILRLVLKNEKGQTNENQTNFLESEYFDFKILTQNANGDKEYVLDMFSTYIENIPLYLNELETFLKDKNNNEIYQTIHKIKSPVLLFGLKNAGEIIQFIEKTFKENKISKRWYSEINKLVVLIEKSVDELIEMKNKL